MARASAPARGAGVRRAADIRGNGEAAAALSLEAIDFASSHHILKGCGDDVGWRNAGSPCPAPDWTPERQAPISLSLGEPLELALTLRGGAGGRTPEPVGLRGQGPGALHFARDDVRVGPRGGRVVLASGRPVPRRIARISLGIDWSLAGGEAVSPARSENVAYVTMGPPEIDEDSGFPEDGVTLKRMDRAVAWVEPLRTLRPHSIVRALMGKFPYYSLKPSPKVPRQFHHPTYFNDEGGAWPLSDHVAESGECQAIVRLVRGILRQLGVPGEARSLLVWADPEVSGGKKAVAAYWDEDPSAGLSRTRVVGGKRWIAALSDAAVEVGRDYPASHTIGAHGRPSPGLNRYEACLEFTHEGVTREYGGGAGIFRTRDDVLRAFWGLVWVSPGPDEGFRVEEIVTTY